MADGKAGKEEVIITQVLTGEAGRPHPEAIQLLMSSLVYPPACEGLGLMGMDTWGTQPLRTPQLGPEVML